MLNLEIENLKLIARTWNNLDVSFIEPILSDNFTYESQWVLIPINGKDSFLSYLNSKFLAIKAVMDSELMKVNAELVLFPSLLDRPGLVITQTTKDDVKKVSLLIKIHESKINRIDICFIPDPSEAIFIK